MGLVKGWHRETNFWKSKTLAFNTEFAIEILVTSSITTNCEKNAVKEI